MKNILIIVPWIPFPLKSGGNQAIFNGIQSIKNSCNVSVFCIDYMPWRKKDFLSKLRSEFSGVKLYISWDYKIVLSEIIRKILGKKFDYKYLNLLTFRRYPKGIFNEIKKIIDQDEIDCVQIEMFDGLPLVENIPANVKKIFVHHELRFLLAEQIVYKLSNKKKFNEKLNVEKKKEIALLNKYDLVITLSENDKYELKRNGLNVDCCSSFAAVSDCCLECPCFGEYEKKITFVGPEQHLPNREGLIWFLENCWNEIKKQDDVYSLHVIGAWNQKTIQNIKDQYKDVFFYGFVDNLYDYLRGSVMIVPIFAGSGIRMKILEAAKMRIPFISTSVGNSGLFFETEKDCLIADDSIAFVKAVFKMENVQFRRKTTESAYKVFVSNYSLAALKENRLSILKQIIK